MGLPEFVDDTVTDYSRPTPSIDVSKDVSDDQKAIWKRNSASSSEQVGSFDNVVSKPMIRFVKETGCPSVSKVNNTKNSRKPTMKYAEMYRNTSQSPKVMSSNFGPPIIENWDSENESEVNFTLNKTVRPSIEQVKFDKSTREVVGEKETPKQNKKVPTAKPIVAAVKGNRGKAVKASACWIWKPKKNQLDQGLNLNGVSGIPQDNIDDKVYWDSGCSRHMTSNISYLSEYEPYNRGYVSFGHGGGKISGKGTLEDALKENVSSLRYIALPNWFHEAQMETSNDFTRIGDAFSEKCAPQKEQDSIISDTDVSESSGNTNPTIITKEPTAKQVEPVLSSTVETEVPTVSTLVPTECLSIPPVISNRPRIISKGGGLSYPE
ncbi:hypothetical protein Tco_0658541, partial [Tanacetum coccineum]